MNCLQRGRMFSQSSRFCVQELEEAIKVAIFRKPSLVYRETLQPVAKINHAQGQMLECLHALSLPEPFPFFFNTFLVRDISFVSFFQHTLIKELLFKHVAFFWLLHGFTGHASRINRHLLLLCFIHPRHFCCILMQLFPA